MEAGTQQQERRWKLVHAGPGQWIVEEAGGDWHTAQEDGRYWRRRTAVAGSLSEVGGRRILVGR